VGRCQIDNNLQVCLHTICICSTIAVIDEAEVPVLRDRCYISFWYSRSTAVRLPPTIHNSNNCIVRREKRYGIAGANMMGRTLR
jgi:hypothetical protein